MTITEFFESVGAPLRNVRWSWGAERSDGVIFLRAWKDETSTDAAGEEWVLIDFAAGGSPGLTERRRHIKAIEAGARCFIVMCEAVDTSAKPRMIAAFDHRTVLVGGKIRRENGDTWIRVDGYKSVFEAR